MPGALVFPSGRVGSFLALLPIRVDDSRFLLRVLLMGPAQALLLHSSDFGLLRDAFLSLLVGLGPAVGLALETSARWSLAVGAHEYGITVECTHIEFAALLAPLLWAPGVRLDRNVRTIVALAGLLFFVGVMRALLALVLLRFTGIGWTLAHDVPLGILYFAATVYCLRRRAWLGSVP